MGDPASGGGGGRNNDLTAAFAPPEPEPERRTAYEFESAALPDEKAAQMEEHLRRLEAERAAPRVQGTEYTIGGSVEQAVHEDVSFDREAQIRDLKEKLGRRRSRGLRQ